PRGRELVDQLLHRGSDLVLVNVLVCLPVRLGVVGLQPFEELERLHSPATKRHRVPPPQGYVRSRAYPTSPRTIVFSCRRVVRSSTGVLRAARDSRPYAWCR